MAFVTKKPAAYHDLIEIWCYIAENSSNTQADALIDRFESKAKTLAKSSKIGRLRPELAKSLRSFAIGKYVMFYFPTENGIEIVRILHGARDIDSIFMDEF